MRLILLLSLAAAGSLLVAQTPSSASGGRSAGRSALGSGSYPVNIATPVDMSQGLAHRSAVVRSGDARFEVLSPTLIRLEYSPSASFEDAPTVNVLDRRMPVPRFSARVLRGWLTIKTKSATLRYEVGSGPFTARNTSFTFTDGRSRGNGVPSWEWVCTFGQDCQSGTALVSGGASLDYSETGYQSSAGYVGSLEETGAGATWQVLGTPGGQEVLSVRYANTSTSSYTAKAQSLDVVVDGRSAGTLTLPPTGATDSWAAVATTVTTDPGTDSVGLSCPSADSCNVNLDTVSLASPGSRAAQVETDPLGGWIRGFDYASYEPGAGCPSTDTGALCATPTEPLHTEGLLDQAGWRLLDDTQSAQWTKQGWVQPRSPGGDSEDGYLFLYGHDYARALETFARLTGSAPLPPANVFGVWYSDFTPYSSSYIESSLYSQFEQNGVPLNMLSLDTEWKAPNGWDGWEWNTDLFPDQRAFLQWARSHGIDVTLNVHSSIDDQDPELKTAESIAGGTLASSTCFSGPCKVWDWSSEPQAESNFAIQQPIQDDGVAFWWFDWGCCDLSQVSMQGLTPDAWIQHLYAQALANQGQRGVVLARIGASVQDIQRVYPAGPWSEHTSAIAFTGDDWGTWNTLAEQVALSQDEATIGEPYVSDDIGSFLGPPTPLGATASPTRGGQDPPDLYDRWVQFGTFQPILRLDSFDENRLPWQYPQPVRADTEAFLRLREELVPYTYTLAAQAHFTGLPMTRPLYLDYPYQSDAYQFPDEYLYGPDVLVAPVSSPGDVAQTTLWIPPGRWVDYFTGATFEGPRSVTVSDPLSRMPVFVRAGGIVPEEAPRSGDRPGARLVLDVFSGSTGRFDLYGDSGSGLGYTKGRYTTMTMTDSLGTSSGRRSAPDSSVTIGAARGHYQGDAKAISYRVQMVDMSRPSGVTLDGRQLSRVRAGSPETGWYYEPGASTVVVDTSALSTLRPQTVVVSGARAVNRGEPAP